MPQCGREINRNNMRFFIRYGIEHEESFYIGRPLVGDRAKTIFRDSSSTAQSQVLSENDNKFTSEQKHMCYSLTPVKKVNCSDHASSWKASATVSSKNLFGPVSLMNKQIVYPCSRFQCWVSCCCQVCRKASQDEEEKSKIENKWDEHRIYHKAWHISCEFCNQIFSIIPMFRFMTYVRSGGLCSSSGHPYSQAKFEHTYKISRKSKEDKLKCTQCEEKFTSIFNQVRHYRSVHTRESYSCEKCAAVFNRKDKLKAHIEDVHEDVLDCSTCKTKFSNYKNIQRHWNERLDVEGKPKYRCDECKKIFCTSRLLSNHVKKHKISCEDCGQIFSNIFNLSRHTDNSKIKVSCQECELEFCTAKKLLTHRQEVHVEFKCDHCNKTYSSKFNLLRHIKAKHESSRAGGIG